MRSPTTGRRLHAALLMVLATAIVTRPAELQGQNKSAAMPLSAELQAAKAALAKYSDPLIAVRDGFYSTVACIDFPKGAKDGPVVYPPGAMGIHLLNTANIGPTLDPTKPQVLIYEQVGDKMKLTAAEWFMPVELAKGTAPSIFGQKLQGPMDGHEPIMPAALKHYDLHVWLWKNNPRGMFTSTNLAVKCTPKATYTVAIGEHRH
ncbi:MAG TPA: hypothetical protein VM053_07605 [Gemmatimonadaceae bacterium]|nr:hypothetical protein [Gemmatimonadaceae bacterium]